MQTEVIYNNYINSFKYIYLQIELIFITENHTNIHEELKNLSKKDRAILELSSTAFMSFLRAYKEHQCSYIFRFDRLNLGSVAKCYALLKLPKIKETKDMTQIDFIPEVCRLFYSLLSRSS